MKSSIYSESNLGLNFILGLLLLLYVSTINASNDLPEYIRKGLDTIPTYEEQFNFLRIQARNHLRTDRALAFHINDYSLELAIKNNDASLIAKSYGERGVLHSILIEYKEARAPIRNAISKYTQLQDSIQIGYQYRNLGLTYGHGESLDSAILFYFESLSFLNPKNESARLFNALTNIDLARAFSFIGNNKNAEKFALRSVNLLTELNDTFNLINAYNTLSLIYMNDMSPTAEINLFESAKLSRETGYTFNYAINLHNIALYYTQIGRYQEALDTLEKAFRLYQESPNRDLFANFYSTYGLTYLFLDKLDKAEYYLNLALKHIDDLQDFHASKAQIYGNLAELYEKKNNFREAFKFKELHMKTLVESLELKNSSLIDFYEKDLEHKATKRKTELLATENLLQEKELNIKQRNIILLSVVSLALLLITGLSIYFYRKIRAKKSMIEASNIAIQKQSAELFESNYNKEILISIIGHDFRAPLNNLEQLLSLIPSEEDKISLETFEILSLSKSSITDMQNLLSNLLVWAKNQKRNLLISKEPIKLSHLIKQVLNLYKSSIQLNRIQIFNEIPEDLIMHGDPDTLEVILRNLLSNALRYSSKHSALKLKGGQVESTVYLIIEDEAGGIPKEIVDEIFNTESSNNKKTQVLKKGLGLVISKELLLANDGSWSYTPTEKGSSITIVFKSLS